MEADVQGKAPSDEMRAGTAPIALFAYNRPRHLHLTIEALQRNSLAGESHLYVFCDGARDSAAESDVAAVRAVARAAHGFKSVITIERDTNLGLAQNIVDGVSRTCAREGRVIVLEDDIVTSPVFLRYMNEALDFYQSDPRVASVHGYCYPVDVRLPETFFLRGADCWGWATWSRAWRIFEPDGRQLLQELQQAQLTSEFDLGGAYGFTAMLQDQIAGRNDSWAVRWHASCFLKNLLTLYPGRSLVQNIGNDATGAHCGRSDDYLTEVASERVQIGGIEVIASEEGRRAFARFLRGAGGKPFISRLRRWWRRVRLAR